MRLTKKQTHEKEKIDFIAKDSKFTGREKDLEDLIIENIHDISRRCGWGDIRKVGASATFKIFNRGKTRERLIIDILVQHTDDTATIIEVKKTNKKYKHDMYSAIGQVLIYGAYIEVVKGAKPRLVIASNEYFDLIKYGIDSYNLPINFLTIKDDEVFYMPNSEGVSWEID